MRFVSSRRVVLFFVFLGVRHATRVSVNYRGKPRVRAALKLFPRFPQRWMAFLVLRKLGEGKERRAAGFYRFFADFVCVHAVTLFPVSTKVDGVLSLTQFRGG